jgi:hypothetical protein
MVLFVLVGHLAECPSSAPAELYPTEHDNSCVHGDGRNANTAEMGLILYLPLYVNHGTLNGRARGIQFNVFTAAEKRFLVVCTAMSSRRI